MHSQQRYIDLTKEIRKLKLSGPVNIKTCHFKGRANPSAGMVDFVQSTLCNLNNDCFDEHEDIPSYNGSDFKELVTMAEPIFKDDIVRNGIEALPMAMKLMKGAVKVLNDTFLKEILGKLFLTLVLANLTSFHFLI